MTFESTTAFIGIGNRASLSLHFHGHNGKIVARIDINEQDESPFGAIFTESWDEHVSAFLRQYLEYWEVSSLGNTYELMTKTGVSYPRGFDRYSWLRMVVRAISERWNDDVGNSVDLFLNSLLGTVDAHNSFEYGCEQFQAICKFVMDVSRQNGDQLNFHVKEV